jgi:hypothetical protein
VGPELVQYIFFQPLFAAKATIKVYHRIYYDYKSRMISRRREEFAVISAAIGIMFMDHGYPARL